MDEHRNVEEWADALLESQRTAPPGTSLEDEPVIRHLRERSNHYAGLQRRFASLEAVAMLIGAVLLGVFALAFHSGF
jgi:hypothetical protein